MKILIVAPMVPQADGAGAIPVLLHAQLEGLEELGDEVTLVTAIGDEPGEAAAAARLSAAGADVHFADRRLPGSRGRRWRRRLRLAGTWARGKEPWRAIWFAYPGIQPIVDRLAETRGFDVAVVEDSAMSSIRPPSGTPAILAEHEVLRPRPVDWHPGSLRDLPRWALLELDWRRRPRFQRRAWGRFNRVLAFSRRDAEAIAELAPEIADRVLVSPFGMNLPPAADPGRERAGTVLFVGNFTHQPNRDAASWLAGEIMPTVRSRHPGARLRMVGTSPTPEVLALGGDGVEVIGDAPSIEPHMEEAAVVVAPVRTGGGMRMKVLQALAAGKAMVTTSRGVEGFDCFDEQPPLALADGADEFAAATAALLDDPHRRAEIGGRAREFAERHFSPAAWAARLERAYAAPGREPRGSSLG
jgi:glycosyltransferase involved in cell wall biosynthesis